MEHIIRDFLLTSEMLSKEGLTYSYTGNMGRKRGERLFITRTGSNLLNLSKEDIISIPLKGKSILDERASSELRVYRAILNEFPYSSLLHVHAPYTLCVSFKRKEITPLDSEGKEALGSVPVLSLRSPSASEELSEALKESFKSHRIAVIRGHGVFCLENSLYRAYELVSLLENSCKILWRCEDGKG
ncbi:class II aldolase/adducin family protein [Aquifex pyrophilus]